MMVHQTVKLVESRSAYTRRAFLLACLRGSFQRTLTKLERLAAFHSLGPHMEWEDRKGERLLCRHTPFCFLSIILCLIIPGMMNRNS